MVLARTPGRCGKTLSDFDETIALARIHRVDPAGIFAARSTRHCVHPVACGPASAGQPAAIVATAAGGDVVARGSGARATPTSEEGADIVARGGGARATPASGGGGRVAVGGAQAMMRSSG